MNEPNHANSTVGINNYHTVGSAMLKPYCRIVASNVHFQGSR